MWIGKYIFLYPIVGIDICNYRLYKDILVYPYLALYDERQHLADKWYITNNYAAIKILNWTIGYWWPIFRLHTKEAKTMYVLDLYNEEDISLISFQELQDAFPFQTFLSASAYAFREDKIAASKVALGPDVEHKEAALWHELGHVKHPLGINGKVSVLTGELAANTYVLKNYQGDAPEEEIIYWLSKWSMSYIEYGHCDAQDLPELRETAKALGIFDKVIWMPV